MKNKLFSLAFGFALVVAGVAATAPSAEAACSANGYYHSNGKCGVSYKNNDYRYQYTYQNAYSTEYLQQYIRQLQALLEQLQRLQSGGYYNQYPPYNTGSSEVDVSTRSATNIDDDRATLRGEVDFNDSDEATVYFYWGRSSNDLRYTTTHVILDDNDDETFEHTITGLNDDTLYYYRAVAEDEDGRRTYGSILSVRTDDHGSSSNDDEEPDVETDSARDITDDSAELRGSVDMNDFNNGDVFFVYGEDEDQVRDVEDDFDSYNDVDEDGDDLQKILVDGDLDSSASYYADISGLNDDTRIYFSICVAYEDEDNDDVIDCGNVEDFRTDN